MDKFDGVAVFQLSEFHDTVLMIDCLAGLVMESDGAIKILFLKFLQRVGFVERLETTTCAGDLVQLFGRSLWPLMKTNSA